MPKPINTVFSVDAIVDDSRIDGAKILLKNKYSSQYGFIPAHFTYMICPMPESNWEKARDAILAYIKNLKPITITTGELNFDEGKRFFSIPVESTETIDVHKNL